MKNFLTNKLSVNKKLNYCCIIGLNPSKGARSPKLWNECFNKLCIKSNFYPFDVESNNLEKLVNWLKKDKFFIGGAVTTPYKEKIIKYLDIVEEEAEKIGAVNLIYKKNNKLLGSNTDGLGALYSLEKKLASLNIKIQKLNNVIILGSGGVAKSVSIYLAKKIGKKNKIFFFGRNRSEIKKIIDLCNNFTNCYSLTPNNLSNKLKNTKLIINCTSVGFENLIKKNNQFFNQECFMPFSITPKKGYIGKGEINKTKWIIKNKKFVIKNIQESISIFSKIHKKALIMDVIYQPEETLFLKFAKCYNLATLSGKQMNTMQAVYAFTKTFKKYNFSLDKIEKLMNKVK